MDLFGVSDRLSYQTIINWLNIELKLIVLAIPIDECIVIPPTYYFESKFCRNIISNNIPYLEAGYIRLIMREPSYYDYLEKKRETFKRVNYIEKYKSAYYSGKYHGIKELPISWIPKENNTSHDSLQIWFEIIRTQALQRGKYNNNKIEELIKLISDTEKRAFIWESVKLHLDYLRISHQEERDLKIRRKMSKSYLIAYNKQGILLPQGSMIAPDVVGYAPNNRSYNLLYLRRILELMGVFSKIVNFSSKQILRLKSNFEVQYVMDRIRSLINAGEKSTEIYLELQNEGLIDKFKLVVKDVSQADILIPSKKHVNNADLTELIITSINDLKTDMQTKVDDLFKKQEIILRKLNMETRMEIKSIINELHNENIKLGEITNLLDAIRRVLKYVLRTGIAINDPELADSLREIYEAINSNLSLTNQLELTIPIIPLFLQYKLDLEAGVDLGAVYKELVKRYK